MVKKKNTSSDKSINSVKGDLSDKSMKGVYLSLDKKEEFLDNYIKKESVTYGKLRESIEVMGLNAPWEGVKEFLFSDSLVKEKVEKAFKFDKEEAIIEARVGYEGANTPALKKYYYDLWLSLQGLDKDVVDTISREDLLSAVREVVGAV